MSKAERTRQFIIEQAAPLFNTKGLAATAMSDIMEATKMAKGGLYGHFESKEELANEVVDYNLKKLVIKVAQAVEAVDTAKQKLFAFLDVFKNPVQFPVDGGCPMVNFGAEADDTNPVVRDKIRSVILSSQKTVADILQDGIEKGEFKKTFNARNFSIKMLTLIEGGTLIGRVLGTDSQMVIIIDMLKDEIEQHML